MGSQERPSGQADRPSAKPLGLVVALLMAATVGAVVTTRADPIPAGHDRPTPVFVNRVTHVTRPGAGHTGVLGRGWV